MRRRWKDLPIRVRAAATALGFLLALFALWSAVDWALPSTLLTARLLEREHLFGPGEVAASGEIVLGGEATKDRYVILRSGDKFASVALERIYGVLWEANVYGGFFIMAPSEERPLAYSFLDRATRTSVSAGRSQITGSHYQLAVSTHDPAVERVETASW